MNEPAMTDRVEYLERQVSELRRTLADLQRNNAAPQYLTPDDVAAMFKVVRGTVYNWISARLIPYRRVNGKPRFLAAELEGWTKPRLKRVG